MNPKSTPKRNPAQPPPYGYIVVDGVWRIRCLNSTTGYMYFCVGKKHVYEHRFIWEQWNGPIPKGYVVHHRDGTFAGRSRNTRDNLALMTIGEHVALHQQKWPDTCAMDGCEAKPKSRGLCGKHYWDVYHAEHKDDPEYKARQSAKSKRWREADPDRAKAHDQKSYQARYPKEREARCAASRARHHAKMQDPEWREKERLRAAAKNARVAARKRAARGHSELPLVAEVAQAEGGCIR